MYADNISHYHISIHFLELQFVIRHAIAHARLCCRRVQILSLRIKMTANLRMKGKNMIQQRKSDEIILLTQSSMP